uniref:Ig-like domain-containing protein n=1 Tax=Sinocyclocheilus rhinocerous TaxID=307959 RepID=A0A673KEI7_9TELE
FLPIKAFKTYDMLIIVFQYTIETSICNVYGCLYTGEDVILPCSIKPNTSAVNMRVEWFRLDFQDSIQNQYFRGRTALFQEELQNGNALLKLSSVQVSDEGVYKCLLSPTPGMMTSLFVLMLEVRRLITKPRNCVFYSKKLTQKRGKTCSLRNVLSDLQYWNPKPELQWLDSKGENLTSDTEETHKDAKCYNVKHRITVHNSETKYHCRVKRRHHMLQMDIVVSSKYDLGSLSFSIFFSKVIGNVFF